MRSVLIAAVAATVLAASPASAKGCLRGAAAGGLAGHMVGKGHGVMGAAAGCAITHHHYAKKATAARKH